VLPSPPRRGVAPGVAKLGIACISDVCNDLHRSASDLHRDARAVPGAREVTMAVETVEDFAVVAYREDGSWQVGVLPERLTQDLDGLVAALRQQPGEGGAIGLVDVADEFFVAIRVVGDRLRMLLSDVTAAVAWDLAAQVVERLGVPVPDDDEMEDVWPAGDLSIFADLGMDEMELGAVLADLDAYADEMLIAIAGRLGFGEPLERALDAAVR
jgi:putative tRNA adenosine deaminase-associated protein